MKDLKVHKKVTSGSGKEAGRPNKGFPDIETLILALVASVTSASRVMAFLQNLIALVAVVLESTQPSSFRQSGVLKKGFNGGVTIILFVVTNLVCVPKKRNLSIFWGLEGAWKHIRTLELKWKNRWNSSYFGNEYRVGFFSYPYQIEHAKPNLLHRKPALFRSGKLYNFMKPCAMARIRSQTYFR
ncbi:hypothetical protein L6164_008607 [Bauhinia variegata]|uniref:Uncharacterized protein n=1 Tax=Bauhinia variegata TaxID=167791 RepID=A0ACB9PHH1_BAUVA|nr:hypothetical protein L6164_008607 [Bauhinia variegata]